MIDVVIPAHNEEKTVAGVIRAFRSCPLIGQTIVIDNLSTDDTYWTAVSAGARVIQCKTVGKGAAVSEGLKHVTTDRVIFCDADLIHFDVSHAAILAQPYSGMLVGTLDGMGRSSGQRSLPTSLARSVKLEGYEMERTLMIAAMKTGIPIKYIELPEVTQYWMAYYKKTGQLPKGLENHFNRFHF